MRRVLIVVCLMLGVVVPVSAPAYAAAPGADCGTPNDTPPAIFISNWSSCSGTHEGETIVDDWRRDLYGFAATVDDVVTVTFSGSCPYTYWAAGGTGGYSSRSFLAPNPGPTDATYEDPQFYDLQVVSGEGFNEYGGGCAHERWSTNYVIAVGVVPNTRPTVAFVDPPVAALPDVPFTVTVSGADPEDALQKAHLRVISSGFKTRNLVAPFDGSGRATFTLSVNGPATLEARADDQYNALSATVSHRVALSQNDCGSGTDAVSTSVPFATSCRGYLFPGAPGDDLDTYTFEAPPGHRIAIEALRATNTVVTEVAVTSPSGVVTNGAPPLFVGAEAGTWQVSVARTGTTYGHYDLSTRAIGSPAPPSVTVTASPPDPHQWDPTTLSLSSVDPNGEWVYYRVDWGDGSPVETSPASGFVPSGPNGGQLSHAYVATTSPRTVTVTATNQEGQSASTTTTITVRAPDDACVGAAGPAMDAPEEAFAPWTPTQKAKFSGRVPRDCRGELGYVLTGDQWGRPDDVDAVDSYVFSVCAGEVVCGGSGTGVNAGRTVEVRVATTSQLRAAVSVGLKGVGTSSAMVTSGSPATFRFVAVPEVEYSVRLERLTSNGWLWTKGSYDLDVTLDA